MMPTPRHFSELVGMEYVDFLILKSVVMWNRQFKAFGETPYNIATDIAGCEFDDFEEATYFIRNRVASALGDYVLFVGEGFVPTALGEHKYSSIDAYLERSGITNVDSIYPDFLTETFKPFKPQGGSQ